MTKFVVAMALFAILELLSWRTLDDTRIRLGAMLIIGMFAWRTWIHHRREALPGTGDDKSRRLAGVSEAKPSESAPPRP